MFITAAYAADATGGAMDTLTAMLPPMIAVFAIMYFIGIRPQQRRQKEIREMLAALRRGDTVVTTGGLVGKISKVLNDNEIQVELAEGVRVRMLRAAVTEVRTKGEPVKDVKDEPEAAEAGTPEEAPEGALAPASSAEGPGAAPNVRPQAGNATKSAGRPSYQKSRGRRR
jgi:preprotein translocase subunit YajC